MSVIPKKRGTRGMRETKRSSAKRAIITLSPGETINLFDSVLQA
jgi:ribosomal protein L23